MLAIQKHLHSYGLDNTIEKFSLICRDYGHKVLLKYDQINSPMQHEEVQDARGIILTKDDWQLMSLAFRKFFNAHEPHAANIDWDSATILQKLDGTLIQLYWDWILGEWCAGTTGTADGGGEVNNKPNTTFAELFWEVWNNSGAQLKSLNKDFVYCFELCTPYNIVVTPHTSSSLTLLSVRNRCDNRELTYNAIAAWTYDVDPIKLVYAYEFHDKSITYLAETLQLMPFSEEGYVVVDKYLNRIKIKNPAYVAAHHLKSKTAAHHIIDILRTNEVDEFVATLPERKQEIEQLKEGYDSLICDLEYKWKDLSSNRYPSRKDFALAVQAEMKGHLQRFTGLMFSLQDGKVKSVRDWIDRYDTKALYQFLKNE